MPLSPFVSLEEKKKKNNVGPCIIKWQTHHLPHLYCVTLFGYVLHYLSSNQFFLLPETFTLLMSKAMIGRSRISSDTQKYYFFFM